MMCKMKNICLFNVEIFVFLFFMSPWNYTKNDNIQSLWYKFQEPYNNILNVRYCRLLEEHAEYFGEVKSNVIVLVSQNYLDNMINEEDDEMYDDMEDEYYDVNDEILLDDERTKTFNVEDEEVLNEEFSDALDDNNFYINNYVKEDVVVDDINKNAGAVEKENLNDKWLNLMKEKLKDINYYKEKYENKRHNYNDSVKKLEEKYHLTFLWVLGYIFYFIPSLAKLFPILYHFCIYKFSQMMSNP
ncbi:hypothetical protein PFAG_00316 [Plasmodium falciparum Santa Lucia]|uniref:Uncharacterized protein n=3 Tax=Plasmodium falciparum TaxID=5833 RepID=C0H467_PLAF7|nr:Plasmodium exported protein, unknown function [Plasmodium falciparum 3D7]EUT92176.1 hypothetical protein PFAG_00316 [Plasmodium falciparum Santa Lucia]EWC90712.1 hypothetical protein PFNF54_00358 [Plasmodium falciparum NF54]KAF4328774.1 hypothetical protein CYL21_2975 [Plasmodium falciparum NF54]PKC45304.1 hypothetical protein CK202_3654 [Plasmodium falciparum NF54]CAX64426.1 Plasmodium exported protein, unknown function [Plasmodium falciparum 3D7]|eukprot:XP_002808617.1 Plasmodium exported protein, unknown function [Plasmodium falciparum 3D7]